jgi:hypothetical protein
MLVGDMSDHPRILVALDVRPASVPGFDAAESAG